MEHHEPLGSVDLDEQKVVAQEWRNTLGATNESRTCQLHDDQIVFAIRERSFERTGRSCSLPSADRLLVRANGGR